MRPYQPTALFYPVGCSQLQPLSSHNPSLCILTPKPGGILKKSQLLELSSASRKYFQESSCIYQICNYECIWFSSPAVIHLLHFDFWLFYSFSKLKCFSCSKISLVFKAKLVSYKNLALLSLINKKQDASVCLPSQSVFMQCISFLEAWFIPTDQKLRIHLIKNKCLSFTSRVLKSRLLYFMKRHQTRGYEN